MLSKTAVSWGPELCPLPGSNHIHFTSLWATKLLGKVMNLREETASSSTCRNPTNWDLMSRKEVTAVKAAVKDGWSALYSGGEDHHHQIIMLQTLRTNGRPELKAEVGNRMVCWRATACAQEHLFLCLVLCCLWNQLWAQICGMTIF